MLKESPHHFLPSCLQQVPIHTQDSHRSENHVRSQKIHAAIAQGNTRFEICQLVAKGVRITHRQGTRLEDSITQVLGMLKLQAASVPPVAGVLNTRA